MFVLSMSIIAALCCGFVSIFCITKKCYKLALMNAALCFMNIILSIMNYGKL